MKSPGLTIINLMKRVCLQFRSILLLLAILSLAEIVNAQHCKVAIQALPNFCDPNSDVITLTVVPTTDPDPPYTYIWSTGATTQTITVPNVVGLISVTVINASGCPATAIYFIPGPWSHSLILVTVLHVAPETFSSSKHGGLTTSPLPISHIYGQPVKPHLL